MHHTTNEHRAGAGRRRVAVGLATTFVAAAVAWSSVPSAPAAAGTRLTLNQPADPMKPVTPSANADTQGMWSGLAEWPMVPIHAVLDQDGQVVTYGALITNDGQALQGGVQYDTWDPQTADATKASHSQSPAFSTDSFCSIAVPESGRTLFIVGGNSEYQAASYDPSTQTFFQHADLTQPRWYASMVRMPDDRMVVIGGALKQKGDEPIDEYIALTPEVWTPGTGPNAGWSSLTNATSTTFFGGPRNRWWYPKTWVAPNGHVFGISYDRMFDLNPNGTGTITPVGNIRDALNDQAYSALGVASSAVMYEPGKILLASGGELSNMTESEASTDAVTIDINGATPAVTRTGSVNTARNWINLVILPDGKVAAVGGTTFGNQTSTAAEHAEVWDKNTGVWTEMAAATRPRSYHSTALLMPNGSVFSGGGGAPGYPTNEENAEFFYPANLFTRQGNTVVWADRPEIRSMSGFISWGGQIEMDMKPGHTIEHLTLTAAGANTHSVSMSARQVPMDFTQTGDLVTATFPTDGNVLPPGLYLLSAVDSNGVPSASQIVEINADNSPGKVTVYGSGPQVPPPSGITPPSTTTTSTTTTIKPPTTTAKPTTTTSTTTTVTAPTTTTGSTGTTVPSATTVPSPTSPSTPTTVTSQPGSVAGFHGTTPARLMDTRQGGLTIDRRYAETGPGGPGSETVVQVTGRGPVPADGVGAVALNVTVTNPTADSFLTVYPTGARRPTASNLNVSPGQTTPNMVIVPVGTNGQVTIFNQAGSADLVVDVLGWFAAGSSFTGITPQRMLDTRALPTIDQQFQNVGALGSAATLTVPIAGRGNVPSTAGAVALNVTATEPTAGTYLTVWPSGAQRPTASNLNVTAGQTRPNMVIVPLGANGAIDLFNLAGSTHVVVDVLGWFPKGPGFTGVTPARLMDTRAGEPTVDGFYAGDGALEGGVARSLPVVARGNVPLSGVGSVALNVTVTNPTADGYLTVFPTGQQVPTASNLNFVAGQTVPNMVIVPVGANGTISLLVNAGSADVVVDVLGWFPPAS